MSQLTVTVSKDKKTLTISIPIEPGTSKSGKNIVIASTHGIAPTSATYNGKIVKLGLNAMIQVD